MKSPSQPLVLFFLVLLVSCGGCKKQADETAPAKTSCLIATQTIKESIKPIYQNSTLESETVLINGESFQVSTIMKSAYTYDPQGRIMTEYNQYAGEQIQQNEGITDSVYYQYTPDTVRKRRIKFTTTGKREEIYVDSLNSQGYIEKSYGGYTTYDAEGYLISRTHNSWDAVPTKIVNGNVIESGFCQEGPLTEYYIHTSDYDLTKPGLPSIKTFYGKGSRNLIMKYRIDTKPYLSATSGRLAYTGAYSYLFDNNNRVKRQIFRGINSGFIFGNGSKVTTTDYTYICR